MDVAVAVSVVAAAVALGAPARAAPVPTPRPDAKAEARRHFQVGIEAATSGAFPEAIVEFTRAYQLSPHFAVLYDLATAEVAIGDAAAAVGFFERYLADGGAAVPGDRRAKVEAELRRLAPLTAHVSVHVAPGAARVSIDGTPIDLEQRGGSLRVNIGAHTLEATLDGYAPARRSVTVASGDVADVTLELVPLSAPVSVAAGPIPVPAAPAAPAPSGARPVPDLAPPRTGAAQRILGYAAGGVGLVSLAAAGLFYQVSRENVQRAANEHCTQAACTGQGAADFSAAQTDVTASRIALVAGSLLVASGLSLILLAPSSPAAPRAEVAPMVGLGLPAGVMLAGRW